MPVVEGCEVKPDAGSQDRGLFRGVLGTLKHARLDRHEIAGSLGDMGTFLPLLVGMASQNGLNFATALFFAGLFNIITGLTFSIPMAVQPMKAIAAVAITEGVDRPADRCGGCRRQCRRPCLGADGIDRLAEPSNSQERRAGTPVGAGAVPGDERAPDGGSHEHLGCA